MALTNFTNVMIVTDNYSLNKLNLCLTKISSYFLYRIIIMYNTWYTIFFYGMLNVTR